MSAIRSRSYGSPYGLALSATVASAPTHRSRQLNFTSQTSLNFGDAAYGGGGVAGITSFSWGTQPYRPQSHGRRHGRGAGCLSQGRADRSSADHADGVVALARRWFRLGRPAASRVGGQSRVTDASDRTARRSRPPRAS